MLENNICKHDIIFTYIECDCLNYRLLMSL